MTSFGYRLNPRYVIKECLSCGALYTKNCSCSKGNIEDNAITNVINAQIVQDFQNISEPSNAITNVINAPREPYVVKLDNGSFVDKISFDLNKAPDSPNQFHCFYCKDVLRDGEACKRCTCAKCGSGLGKGHCYICGFGFVIGTLVVQLRQGLEAKCGSVCSPTVRIIAFQAIDPGSTPGKRTFKI
nr:hypothetical protein [Tanacetum cinerariifolium]